jgi:hypothetical protein
VERIRIEISKTIFKHKQNGDNYYVFKNVITKKAVAELITCMSKSNFHSLADKRCYTPDGNKNLTMMLRAQHVYFKMTEEEEEEDENDQSMIFGRFYLEVAERLGMVKNDRSKEPMLCPLDMIIRHSPCLKVFDIRLMY